MHPEIEKLIDLAIADGQITEKERNVILKKAAENGVDADEVEMIIDAKMHLKEKETIGSQIKCPSCGKRISGLAKTCSCGYVFNTGSIQESKSLESAIETLENLIIQVRGLSSTTSKEVIESLNARVEKEIRFIKIRYSDNNEIKKLLSELEVISDKYINKAFKKSKSKKYITIFIISIITLILSTIIYKRATKKTIKETFTVNVNDKYLENYQLYKSSKQYQTDLKDFNNLYYTSRLCNNFTNETFQDSVNKEWAARLKNWNKNISEFYFYSRASTCYLDNDLINAKLFIDTALVLNPNFSPIYFRLHQIVENKDSSLQFISKAISLDKEFGYIYLPFRSEIYYDKNDYQNSLKDIKLYLEKYPKNLELDLERYTWKIAVMIDAGLKGEACEEFSKLNSTQIEELKIKRIDTYNLINDKCKK